MLIPMDVSEMPGGMEDPGSKGKSRGNPSGYFETILPVDPPREERPTSPPALEPRRGTGKAMTTLMGGSKKKHIKKPEDFINAKDWDKFKHQEFLYYKEYEDEFTSESIHILFDLSIFIGGLPEKFTANFIDQIMVQTIL